MEMWIYGYIDIDNDTTGRHVRRGDVGGYIGHNSKSMRYRRRPTINCEYRIVIGETVIYFTTVRNGLSQLNLA